MSTNHHSDPTRPDHDAVGDQNVERLLSSAYTPAKLDPAFVARVRQHAQSEAQRKRLSGGRQIVNLPSRLWQQRRWQAMAATVALVVLVAVAYLALRGARTEKGEYYRDGDYVWIDGQPFVRSGEAKSTGTRQRQTFQSQLKPVANRNIVTQIDARGLVPRKRTRAAAPRQLVVGQSMATGLGERRHVTMPDGSQLFVNENASLKIVADRKISVPRGEVFVVVSPMDSGDRQPTFVVQTPDRDVTAWGTRFAVNVADGRTGVVVTQGKVRVSGIEPMIQAGQQLHPDPADGGGAPNITGLPRADHVLEWMRDLIIAAESPLVPRSEYDGGALVAIDPSGQQMKLSLRKYQVDVHIEDGFARTTIDQTYFNHRPDRLEGTFYFPLPADASISRLAMYVSGRLMEGGMAEREHARNVFESIKHRSLDPALLEWIDGSTFKMRVFPLEGRQEKRIILSYAQKLDSHYGDMQYRFPAGHNMGTVRNWSVKVHVVDGAALKWKCSSHDLAATTQEGDLTLAGSATNITPDRDIVVGLSDERSIAESVDSQARFSSAQHDGWQYLMFRWRPELPRVPLQRRRDWVFLLDTDGSRDPLLARVQVDIVRTLLENAGHDDTFSVLTAGTRISAFASEQKPVTPGNLAAAVEFLDTTHLVGALDLRQALVAARGFTQAASAPTLVHVGSGVPILGQRNTGKLLDELPRDVPYIGVAVGKRWNRHLMKGAATRSGGFFTQINPDESVPWRTLELLSTLNAPRLLDIQVAADKQQCEFLVVKDSVAHGEELCALARLEADQPPVDAVTITGQLGSETLRRDIRVENVKQQATYLPRMWAKLAIDEMVMRDAQANKAAIIELSKSMYVMSPFTSLLVLENDAMYDQYHVDRGRKDHWALYPCPETVDVVHEPLEGPQQGASPDRDTPTAKPSPAEVLRTLLVRLPRGNMPIATAATTVSGAHFADTGTLLFGGIRRQAIPTFDRLSYLNHLFTNVDIGRETESLMMMVTPRIIIQEEEEPAIRVGEDVDGDNFESFDPNRRGTVFSADADFDSLTDLIHSTIQPSTWGAVGGPGAIKGFPSNLSLIMSQTQSVQDGREQLLTGVYPVSGLMIPPITPSNDAFALERYDRFDHRIFDVDRLGIPFPEEPPFSYPDAEYRGRLSNGRVRYALMDTVRQTVTADNQVNARLDERSDFNYHDATLDEIVDDLRTRLNIPIALRAKVPEQSSTAVDMKRLTLSLRNVSIRSALRLILDKFGWTYYLEDGTLQITTPSDLQQHLALRSRWLDETLLLFGNPTNSDPSRTRTLRHQRWRSTAAPDQARYVDTWSRRLLESASQNRPDPNLLYPTLHTSSDAHAFRNLTAFVPGIATTRADILAVLDSEAEFKNRPQVGSIEKRARELIDAARDADWQLITLPDFQITLDGRGRFRLDRKTEYGLSETVICDGITLRHLYPQLGLGTTRMTSRFHRQSLAQLVPWFLPPAEDLAVGADLRLIGPRTIAIAPHGADADKDAPGQFKPYLRVHLFFASDGRLAELRLVELPGGATKARIVFTQDRSLQYFDGENTLIKAIPMTAESCAEPDLAPEIDALVILPLPIRDRQYILDAVHNRRAEPNASTIGSDALKKIVDDQLRMERDDPVHWHEEDALRLAAACLWQDPAELRSIIGRRFFARGDRRIGFYTLLLSSGEVWSLKQPVQLSDNTTTRMNPVKDHPHSRLARYIERELEAAQKKPADSHGQVPLDSNSFIDQLSDLRALYAEWSSVRELSSDVEIRRRSLDQLFDFIARCDSARSAYVLLRRVQRRLGNDQPHARIAEAIIRLEDKGVTSYVVKYELARSLAATGQKRKATDLFVDLYRQTLDAGILPPIDQTFIEAMKGSDTNPFGNSRLAEKGFPGFMRAVCDRLCQRHQQPAAIALAWQCRQLGQPHVANRLFDQATAESDEQQLATQLAALNYLLLVKDYDRALTTIDPLLTRAENEKYPSLWRLAARVAEDGQRLAQSIRYMETALELEFENLPQHYSVKELRERYGQLFDRYLQLAKLTTVAGEAAPKEFISRSIQAADRWRVLDLDVTQACQQASRLLASLGLDQLAWDYLTTPLAMKPNEAAAWLDLAQKLGSEKSYDLASRAYASAHDAEPTNAQILWDQAQLLKRAGRADEARALYEQIARGQWQPRFQSLQRRAQSIVAAASE